MFQDTCLWNGIFVDKMQIKSLEKAINLAIYLKVEVGNVKYIFNINILVNQEQNNISAVGEIF